MLVHVRALALAAVLTAALLVVGTAFSAERAPEAALPVVLVGFGRARRYRLPRVLDHRPHRPRYLVSAEEVPHEYRLRALLREEEARLPEVHPSTWKLLQFVDPVDAAQIRLCQEYVLRVEDKRTGWQHLDARRCKNPYCPYCGVLNHRARAYYHARKLASVNPAINPQPRVLNLVFELPVPFHALVRHEPDLLLPAWRAAIRRTIAGAYRYEGTRKDSAEEVCWRAMGALFNFHAIGDAGKPWPKWFPHYDLIIPAFIRKDNAIKPLRETWPERYTQTAARYQRCLRAALLPIVQKPPLLSVELQAFLASDFDVIWHVSKPPRTGSSRVVHGEASAMHRIWYSCRPLVQLDRAQLHEVNGKTLLNYEPPDHHGKPLRHRIPVGPAFGQIRSLHPFLFGEHARTQAGIFGNRVYPDVARLAGHEPVYERDRKNRRIIAAYGPNEAGRMVEVDPRTLRPAINHRKEPSA